MNEGCQKAASQYKREDCDFYCGKYLERYDEIAVLLPSDISLIKRYPEILYRFAIGGFTTNVYKISEYLFW